MSDTTPAGAAVPILELRKATKKYAGVPAIEDVDFALLPGEIHAIVGENGAGKSTLTNVMAGVVTLSSGPMLIARTPLEACDSWAEGAPLTWMDSSVS